MISVMLGDRLLHPTAIQHPESPSHSPPTTSSLEQALGSVQIHTRAATAGSSVPSSNTGLRGGCLHRMTVPPGQFCSPDCDKCPKWGAKECLYSKHPPNLAVCDLCPKYGAPGCTFGPEDAAKTIQDMTAAIQANAAAANHALTSNPAIIEAATKRVQGQRRSTKMTIDEFYNAMPAGKLHHQDQMMHRHPERISGLFEELIFLLSTLLDVVMLMCLLKDWHFLL